MDVGVPSGFLPSPVQKEEDGAVMYLKKSRMADL